MEILERKVENLSTRAKFVPSSLNEEARTIDVVFVTENPVRTFSWEDGVVDEVLLCDTSNVRQERFKSGVPVLDNHSRWEGTKAQIGVVENYRFENGQGLATLRFSKRKDVEENQWQDAKDGILRGISVGYSVHKYEITKEDGKRPQYRAVDWEPLEISFAPVQADAGASVRSQQEQKPIIQENKKPNTMNEIQKRALAVGLSENATEQEVIAAERKLAEDKTKNEEAVRKAAVETERARCSEITESVRKAGLDSDFAKELISKEYDINKCRELIINKMAEKETPIDGGNRSIKLGKEQSEKVAKAIEDSIIHRAHGGDLTEEAKEFRGHNLLDLARFHVEQTGTSTKGMSRRQVAEMALRGYHSSSDFPSILGNTVNRTLRKAYDMQTRTFLPFVRRVTNPDFKTITRAQLSGLVGGFDTIPEGGEYKHSTFTDGKETYQLAKYGKVFGITWEALMNDDLSAFTRIPMAIAAKAAQKQSDIVYNILLNNPTMADSVALFHADHGNLASSGTTIPNGMSAARAAMRKQTDPNGDFINVMSKYLLVGPDKETEAQQLINATIVAAKTSDTNVFRASHEIIAEPRITGNKWFLIADPAMVDTIEICFLDGEGELFTEQRTGFDVDGIEFKARMVFAAKAIDHRGMFYNPGA